ncbi:hypothetical protein SAMN06272735_8943 [Streptomyces sp. TLI_55]|nr:hypothetical protein SAMN06272735_8943 [Streptomyces sp. TLI_55]
MLVAAAGCEQEAGESAAPYGQGSASPAPTSGRPREAGLALRTGATPAPPKVLDIGAAPLNIIEVVTGLNGLERPHGPGPS